MEVEEDRDDEEVEEFELGDVEGKGSVAESRLARRVANFGMALSRYYTLRRINSELFDAR